MRIEFLAAVAAGLSPVQLLAPAGKETGQQPDRSTRAADPDHASRRRRWMEERPAKPKQ